MQMLCVQKLVTNLFQSILNKAVHAVANVLPECTFTNDMIQNTNMCTCIVKYKPRLEVGNHLQLPGITIWGSRCIFLLTDF